MPLLTAFGAARQADAQQTDVGIPRDVRQTDDGRRTHSGRTYGGPTDVRRTDVRQIDVRRTRRRHFLCRYVMQGAAGMESLPLA